MLTRMEEKTGRRFGTWVLQTGEVTYRRADGSVVAIAEGRVARTPRAAATQRAMTTRHSWDGSGDVDSEAAYPELVRPVRHGSRDSRVWESVSAG